ncbi:DNA-binding GntR family transcriptional regulator [Stella humosa]|uniref:DNA-binding GntR family transcriptional regulator n=1 Tax=Stella humosa TaxID=94 RepID=A0A3N1LND2_9PROT|nr:DNA-binding GntR family transcriptional regulator [Stella humosa]BBK29375.1 GntR family transcriptional regulator [Stella humosa]
MAPVSTARRIIAPIETPAATTADSGEDGLGKSLGDRAYDQLLDRMLEGVFAAGTLLQERALAEMLGISRTPVREALAKLESEGFVTRHAGRLLVVREVPLQELMEILHVRAILETEAAGIAAGRVGADELRALRRLFEAQLQGPLPDGGDFWAADDRLHGVIVDAAGNAVLAVTVRTLRRRTRMFNLKRLPERLVPGCHEHLAIVDALERGDGEAARTAMATHLDNTRRSILAKLEPLSGVRPGA